jgi:repressor LexA
MKELTHKQTRVLDFIQKFSRERGYPPTIREIGSNFRIGPRAAKEHLDALERKGCIRRKRGARMIEIQKDIKSRMEGIPLVGKVAAGVPLLAEEHLEGFVKLDDSFSRGKNVFFLKVRGESMKGSGIWSGDLLLVSKENAASIGDIVVARIGDEATVKFFYRKKGRISLVPDNPEFQPLEIKPDDDFEILGRVIGLWRSI